ncbi:class I SAM-dependent methyltransferase [Citricoccus muralis]|uniref:Class I SAM-dependent methyltransferase n=1 Tax=Citricoccus muralis TaxID=169134 RepID=A0ABY8H8Y2_9MICC|nr:class I SAM-dependent methyltransferase [Citricoccus muralis]WFP17067.1 class I SAM-dependent methyltransferase [Citricoccus muralis]
MTGSSIQNDITRYWDQRAPLYHGYQQHPDRRDDDRRIWAEAFRAVLPEPPARVLDLGTGSGFLAWVLADLGHQVTGTDLSPSMLRLARGHIPRPRHELGPPQGTRPTFEYGDAVRPDAAECSIDVITSRYLLWTLCRPHEAISNWYRIVRPGGMLAMADASWFPSGLEKNPTRGFAQHYHAAVRHGLPLAETDTVAGAMRLMRDAGFLEVQARPLTTLHEIDRHREAVPGHEPQLQHLITAVRPRSSSPETERWLARVTS